MKIGFKDKIAWVSDVQSPLTPDERIVLMTVVEALPGLLPKEIKINEICSYVQTGGGLTLTRDERSHWVEYDCRVLPDLQELSR